MAVTSALAPPQPHVGGPRFSGGAAVPVEDLLDALEGAKASALALSLVTIPTVQAARTIGALRGGMSDDVHLFLGGPGGREIELCPGVEHISSLEDLEQRVLLLGYEHPNTP